MSAEILLELKQKSKNSNNISNSEFSVNLPRQILRKGDSINLHAAYIDSIEEAQGKILIDESNRDVNLTYGIYVQDGPMARSNASDAKKYYAADASNDGLAAVSRPNGKNYILSSQDPSSGGGIPMVEISKINVSSDIDNDRFIRDAYMKLHFEYVDAGGNIRSWYGEFKKSSFESKIAEDGETEGQIFTLTESSPWHTNNGFPILARRDGFGANIAMRQDPNNSKDWHDAKLKFDSIPASGILNLVTDSIYTPMRFNITIRLDTGLYQPQNLVKQISDKLQNATNNNGQIPTDQYSFNNLTRSLTELIAFGQRQNPTPDSINKSPFFVAQDASDVLQFKLPAANGNKNYIFGTNGISLGVDDEGYASFDILHLSRYNGSSKTVNQFTVNNNKLCFNKVSGIFFIDSSDSTYDLLINKLNFSPRIFSKIIGTIHGNIGTLTNSTFSQFDLVNSVNVTGESIFNDSLINKTSDPNLVCYDEAVAFPPPSLNPVIGEGSVLTNQQSSIKGIAPVSSYGDADDRTAFIPYYQLEISSSFNFSKITDTQNSRRIMAIINRYYNSLNYTIGDGSNSVVYIHQSDDPLMIDSFNIRILDPEGNKIDEKINDDNTVFLKIIRGNI